MIVWFYDIEWDTDGEEVELPERVELFVEDDEVDLATEGADLLADKYGWCVASFRFKVV